VFGSALEVRGAVRTLMLLGALTTLSQGCAPDEPAFVDGEIGVFRPGLTVDQAGGCSTAIVAGLTAQLIAEQNCIKPNALANFKSAGISAGSAVNTFLEPPAVNALKKAVAARGGTIIINSALRSLAQQYLLYKWQGSCGIQIAASPGSSNHETGIALDVDNYDVWRTALEAQGWDWYGSGDRVHYDYRGPGAVDLRATSVQAFQRLWNLNNPNDKIAEDGDYGPMTAARMAKTPTTGFPKGATCSSMPPANPPTTPPTTPPGTTQTFGAELIDRGRLLSLESGEIAGVTLVFKNTGTATWTPSRTRLGTVGPRDRDSALMADGWLAPNRPAAVQAETKPGELGVFTFAVTAPPVESPRAYSEDFGLVEEGVTWFGPEMGLTVELEVAPASGPMQSGVKPVGQAGCSASGSGAPVGAAPLALLLLVAVHCAFRRRRGQVLDESGAAGEERHAGGLVFFARRRVSS
jgi:hypothetical protein